jgi:hypothetical protein
MKTSSPLSTLGITPENNWKKWRKSKLFTNSDQMKFLEELL